MIKNTAMQLTKYCEWHNCKEKGVQAPTSRDKLRVFKFFV